MFPYNSPKFIRAEYEARIEEALRNQRYGRGARQVPPVVEWVREQLRRLAARLRGGQHQRRVDRTA